MWDAFSAAGSLVHRPCGPAEVRQAAVGADAGAGEHDDPPARRASQPAHLARAAPRPQATGPLTMT